MRRRAPSAVTELHEPCLVLDLQRRVLQPEPVPEERLELPPDRVAVGARLTVTCAESDGKAAT